MKTFQIIVRGDARRTFYFMMCLKKLLPDQMHSLIRVDAQHQHSISADYKIISISNEIAVPIASASIFRVDFLPETDDGNDVLIKWPGTVPNKCETLIQKAKNDNFNCFIFF